MTENFPTSLPSLRMLFPFFTPGFRSRLIPTTHAPVWEPRTMACSHNAPLQNASPFPAFNPILKPWRENFSVFIYVLSLYCFFMIYPFPEEKVVSIKPEDLICSLLETHVWHIVALEKIYMEWINSWLELLSILSKTVTLSLSPTSCSHKSSGVLDVVSSTCISYLIPSRQHLKCDCLLFLEMSSLSFRKLFFLFFPFLFSSDFSDCSFSFSLLPFLMVLLLVTLLNVGGFVFSSSAF